jgi:hypothetical protein
MKNDDILIHLGEKTPAHLHAKGSLERILSYGIIIEDEITQSLLKIKIRTENVLYLFILIQVLERFSLMLKYTHIAIYKYMCIRI